MIESVDNKRPQERQANGATEAQEADSSNKSRGEKKVKVQLIREPSSSGLSAAKQVVSARIEQHKSWKRFFRFMFCCISYRKNKVSGGTDFGWGARAGEKIFLSPS